MVNVLDTNQSMRTSEKAETLRRLYQEMKREDFSRVIRTVCSRNPHLDNKRAHGLLDAFLQWISCVPLLEEGGTHQMIRSIDMLWEAFILNSREYREFCNKYLGFYVDHDALDVQEPTALKEEYAKETLQRIRFVHGESLNPELLALDEGVTCCYWKVRRNQTCLYPKG